MKIDDVKNLPDDAPISLADGKFGLVIRFPVGDGDELGIQVPGESDIRWVNISNVHHSGQWALVERAKTVEDV